MKGFLLAGTASGVGKTTIALAIMAGLRRRGLAVQPFKCGPDFLDTTHHTQICGRPSRNLDTWMLSVEANRDVIRNAAKDADVLIAEGMMGLFDGKSGDAETGSSAEIAKLLKLPVVLIVDAAKTARSIAAVVLGFELFDPELQISGVILNRVASERHFAMLQTAIHASCKTKILGWFPKEAAITIPERHLGLHQADEQSLQEEAMAARVDTLAALAEKHLELDKLLELHCGMEFAESRRLAGTTAQAKIRIGVARDAAFSFYYEDNLDLLQEHGAELVPFSPIRDGQLPNNLNALYLGGGYPELHARELSANSAMRDAIKTFAATGKPIYAECGGMIYLSNALRNIEGEDHALCGVLPLSFEMTGKLVHFGYATVEFVNDCLLGPKGTIIRGHSFHYSRIAATPQLATSYRVQYSMSGKEELEGFQSENILASYIHLHFRSNPVVVENLIGAIHRAASPQAVGA